MSREALVLLVCCCDFRDGAERLISSKSLRNAVIRAFPGLFCILRMCAAAVVRPRGREKSADRRRRILISRLLIIRASVPRRKSPFPAYFKGFPAVSPLIPPYPAFLKYPVSPQLCLIVVLEFTPLFGLIHQLVQRSDFTILIVSTNIAVLLMTVLSILSFDVDRLLANLWIINILILAVLLLDSILLFLHQRRIQEQKRIHMIEQYVPIVEELISQVRARQHEFNNRMMAIEAAVTSADTIEEARKEVTALTGSIGISLNDRELLSCDSKMIAGMLFGKIKQAEAANHHIELSLHGLFKKTVTPETEWIEVIGILLDNAIEASPKGSTIFLSSKKQGDFLELTVSNPAPPLSNTEFMALFGKGVTTKTNRDGHGFGLYNILRMTERYHGKILTRNESILNENYVVFGVLMP